MRNLDEKITRRQAMQEQVVAMLRSTTNKVCKTMLAITGTGTISKARQELNDGIRGVRTLIRQLENDPTDVQVSNDIRTSGCVYLSGRIGADGTPNGEYLIDLDCVKATFGETSDHYMQAEMNARDGGHWPWDGYPYPEDVQTDEQIDTYWDENPTVVSIDLDTALRNVLYTINGQVQPEDVDQLRDEVVSNATPGSPIGDQIINSKKPGPRILPEVFEIVVRDLGLNPHIDQVFGQPGRIINHSPTPVE